MQPTVDHAGASPANLSNTARNLTFVVIMAGLTCSNLLFSVLPPALPAMAAALGARGAWVTQLLFVLPSLGLMLAGIASGWIIDRASLRLSLIASALFYGVMGGLPLFTANIPLMLASRLCLGMACAVLSTSCTLLLALNYVGNARSRVLGYQAGVSNIFGVAALVFAGVVVKPLGWQAPFAIYGLLGIVVLVFVLLGMPGGAARFGASPAAGESEQDGGSLRVVKSLWPVYLSICLLFTIAIAAGGALPFVLQQRGITSAFEQSLIIGSFTIFGAVGSFSFGKMYAALGARRTLATTVGICGFGMFLIGVGRSEALTCIGEGLGGLGLGAFIPYYYAMATNAFSGHLRSRAVGFLNTAMFLGGFLAAFIIAGLNHVFGRSGAFTAIGLAAMTFALSALLLRRSVLVGDPVTPAAPAIG